MSRPDCAILLISCLDQKGLVARISEFLHRHEGNILCADQHIDAEVRLFLMRVEWDLHGFELGPDRIAAAFEPVARELKLDWQLRFSHRQPKTALFVSKYGHCLSDLLFRHRSGELNADISLIVSNHPDLRSVAEFYGIEYLVIPVTAENKAAQEKRILEELASRQIEFVVLARYMQILTPAFVDHFPNAIINIHHSFLPAFVGSKPYHQAYRRGVKIIGATSHYVTSELDDGPIIVQDVIHISHRDSVEDLVRKGRDLEKTVLARAVRFHLEDRVLVYGNKTVVFE